MKDNITKMPQLRELQDRISQLDSEDFSERDLFHRQTVFLIRKLFGKNSQYLDDWKKINIPQMDYNDDDAPFKYSHEWETAKAKMANICKVMIEEINTSETENGVETEESKEKKTKSNRVFVVHGTDHTSLKELKTLLEGVGLTPIILHEQPSKGMTLIEKLEEYSNVGFAFIILTPDDLGLSKTELAKIFSPAMQKQELTVDEIKESFVDIDQKNLCYLLIEEFERLKDRARQNVVLEFGYFIGKLGRGNVCCLYKGSIELPSDMQGIIYVHFENSVNEVRETILKELEATGYEVKS